MRLLLFVLDNSRYAIRSDAVVEVVRAVAVTPLPSAPGVIEGIIDVRGLIVPVFDLRRRFGLSPREISVDDHFILARGRARVAALHVDRVIDLADVDDHTVAQLADHVAAAEYVAGVAKMPDGLALIHDVDTFLSAAESESLDAAMDAAGAGRTA